MLIFVEEHHPFTQFRWFTDRQLLNDSLCKEFLGAVVEIVLCSITYQWL